jgi:hypothetical protein
MIIVIKVKRSILINLIVDVYLKDASEKLGNTKVIFRRRKSWKDRQYND